MRFPHFAKKAIQRFANRFGYRVEQIRSAVAPIDIFDVIIRSEIQNTPDFFFVQVGANDGVSDDPFRKYILHFKLRGLLIEPQPEVFQRLVGNYQTEPQLQFANVAVASQPGTLPFYTSGDGSTLVASFDEATVRRNLGSNGTIKKILVTAAPLPQILQQHNIQHISLLMVDAEGYDFEIIKSIDFLAVAPKTIVFEHINLNEADYLACLRLLGSHGYRTLAQDINTIAYKQSTL